jgi:hypothetical protein
VNEEQMSRENAKEFPPEQARRECAARPGPCEQKTTIPTDKPKPKHRYEAQPH